MAGATGGKTDWDPESGGDGEGLAGDCWTQELSETLKLLSWGTATPTSWRGDGHWSIHPAGIVG